MTNTGKVTVAIVGSLTVGVLIGLMIAPEKGSDLRKQIGSKASGVLENLLGFLSAAGEEASAKGENIKKMKGEAMDEVENLKNSVS